MRAGVRLSLCVYWIVYAATVITCLSGAAECALSWSIPAYMHVLKLYAHFVQAVLVWTCMQRGCCCLAGSVSGNFLCQLVCQLQHVAQCLWQPLGWCMVGCMPFSCI